MKPTICNRSLFNLLCISTFVLCGCSSLRPISSKPSYSTVVFKEPTTAKSPFSVYILPPGEYKVLYEDDSDYYYQAPAKIIAKDIFGYLYDGGIYMKRGSTNLTGFYVITPNGQKANRSFNGFAPYELKP